MLVKKQSGFTLVEIAVVLVIVGLLVGSFIGNFVSRIDATKRDNTKNEQPDIKQVLIAYAFSQGPNVFLPCPDTDVPPDGSENRLAGACTPGGALGALPWITLGLGREDAWATRYRYWVNDAYAINTVINPGFDLTSDDAGGGNATVQTRVNDVAANMVTNAVAVIFSHGKNSLGGVSVAGVNQDAIPVAGRDDENENGDGDQIYMARSPSEEGSAAAGGVFDDIVIWINYYQRKAKMVEAGQLP